MWGLTALSNLRNCKSSLSLFLPLLFHSPSLQLVQYQLTACLINFILSIFIMTPSFTEQPGNGKSSESTSFVCSKDFYWKINTGLFKVVCICRCAHHEGGLLELLILPPENSVTSLLETECVLVFRNQIMKSHLNWTHAFFYFLFSIFFMKHCLHSLFIAKMCVVSVSLRYQRHVEDAL